MKLKLALVNYLNTKPFVYGLKKMDLGNQISTILATPAECADLLYRQEVDISLMPVAAIHKMPTHFIHTDYCIGCKGPVKTVAIFSNSKIQKCHTIYLDSHSRTSALLAQILVNDYWKIENVDFETIEISDNLKLKEGEAVLMIGDKVFRNDDKYTVKYDLGEVWHQFTGLPFVFAAWISAKPISDSIIATLNDVFSFGIRHIPQVIREEEKAHSHLDLRKYYEEHISYKLDASKRKALKTYLKLSERFVEEKVLNTQI